MQLSSQITTAKSVFAYHLDIEIKSKFESLIKDLEWFKMFGLINPAKMNCINVTSIETFIKKLNVFK